MVQAARFNLDCVVFGTALCAPPKNNKTEKHPSSVPLHLVFDKVVATGQLLASSFFSTKDHQSFLQLTASAKLYPIWQQHNLTLQSKVCNDIGPVHLCVCVCVCVSMCVVVV